MVTRHSMTPATSPGAGQRRRSLLRLSRAALAAVGLTLMVLTGACSNLARVSDESIPRLLTPLSDSDFKALVAQLEHFTSLQALRSTRVLIQFNDAESAERYRTADGVLVLQRPDKIRLIIQVPVTGTQIADMVSDANRFRVAIYTPQQYRRFLIGTNDADYSRWREKLGREGRSALVDARPFHFTEALMLRPLRLGEPGFVYTLGEELAVEPDRRQGAKREARVLRSFYVITEAELPAGGEAPGRVRRRFWFDRAAEARFARQQIFDGRGSIVTDVEYAAYQKLNADHPAPWPGVVTVSRPHDGYSAKLTFSEGRFEINPADLPETVFVLENKEKLPETDLDKPEGSAAR